MSDLGQIALQFGYGQSYNIGMTTSTDNLVTLKTVPTDLEGRMIASALSANGVEAQVTGEFTAGFRAEAPGQVRVVVRSEDLDRAQEILASIEPLKEDQEVPDLTHFDTLTHFDEKGASRMVDVGEKPITRRTARASGIVRMLPATRTLIMDRRMAKGDVLEVARLAGIMAAKKTDELIPLCHPLPLDAVRVDFSEVDSDGLRIEATVEVTGKTGVEMEALTAVSVAALTIYDMCKSVDRGMRIEQIQLEEKTGGRSGHFLR
jgi:cyclic pyranopterin phosphate synthase